MTALTAKSEQYKEANGSVKKEPLEDSDTPILGEVIPEVPKVDESKINNNNSQIENSDNSTENDLSEEESQKFINSLQLIKDLDLFLATAPVNWHENQVIRRYFLNKEEGFVSCVYWNNLYFITGTDIVRCIAYKMCHIGREIVDRKKFEEGVFSDLRALKCGTHAILENSRSPFLKFLHRNQCLRTQKKQKVFFWFSVPHTKLFTDFLERDLKRELSNQPATTKPINGMFNTFKYDQSRPILEQLSDHFSSILSFNVSHLLLKTNPILSTNPETIKPEQQQHVTQSNHNIPQVVPQQQPHAQLLYPQQSYSNISATRDQQRQVNIGSAGDDMVRTQHSKEQLQNTNQNNIQITDDFPLDFIDAEPNYLNGYNNSENPVRFNGKLSFSQSCIFDDGKMSPSKGSQIQYVVGDNIQPFDQSDSLSYGSINHTLLSATYQPYSNQQMYILSGLPSAIDPTSTLNLQQSQSQSGSISQLIQLPVQHTGMTNSPTTIVGNNESHQGSIDGFNFQGNDQNLKMMPQYIKSQSPSLSGNFMNFPSSGYIPVYMPLPTASSKDNILFHNDSVEVENINESMENKNGGVNSVEINESAGQKAATELKEMEPKEKDNETSDKMNSTQKPDYMMLSMPSAMSNNFGRVIVGGQLFTPGNLGMEYNVDNYALGSGVGISPVIGFNNGMLSAIQYQSANKPNFEIPNDRYEHRDSNEDTVLKNKDSNGIQNIDGSKVTKPRTAVKKKFLNPTLQRLQLESYLDENEDPVESDENEDKIPIIEPTKLVVEDSMNN